MDTYLIEDNCYEKLAETYEKYGSLIIAVDFDDTIFDFHKKGRSYDDVINLLKRWQKRSKIVIWTNSPEERYPFIEEYCNSIGLEIFGVNTDVIPEMAGRKIYANIYLDDHGGLPSSYRILKKLMDHIEENESK